ncbi:MAG: transaldolase [Thermoleophilia bacterium]|nr:transaldolase [Thermoleophilia bacterium]
MKNSPLAALAEFGQSVWYDSIGRDLLTSGKLRQLVEEDGISGVTSNPTIFYAAISTSSSYDESIRRLAAQGLTAEQIVEALMVEDVRLAADILWPVFEQTRTRDGWVSLEISPRWAHDRARTVEEALRLRESVGRPNVMIKVPATDEGVLAVRDLTALGCPVNVTLIFSVARYLQVAEAYISGLELLLEHGSSSEAAPQAREVHSVASFFVSRIDTKVDSQLEAMAGSKAETLLADVLGGSVGSGSGAVLSALLGKTAVAVAKVAYKAFREVFCGPRWERLCVRGANVQRLLWASTSTKNPAYSDILYVQELIGPDTVTTLPPQTVAAFKDHGRPMETITAEVDKAEAQLRAISHLGIDLDELASTLEREGLEAFATSAAALEAAVAEKAAVLGGV